MQNILRPALKELSEKLEFEVSDARPNQAFWEHFDNERFIRETLEKHDLQTGINDDEKSNQGSQ